MSETVSPLRAQPHSFLERGGEAARQILTFNWTGTSLGALEQWPQSLFTTLSILLHHSTPTLLLWGPQHLLFANDTALSLRPQTQWIGQPASAYFAHRWPEIAASLNPGQQGVDIQPVPPGSPAADSEPAEVFTPVPVYNEAGTIGGWLLQVPLTRTVSEKDDIIHRLRLLEAQMEALPSAVMVVDRMGKILSYNHQFAALWRIPANIIDAADDTAALSFAMTQVADPQAFIERVYHCYSHPELAAHDDVLLKDGRVLERYGNAVTNTDGTQLGYIWHFNDVTALRLSEEQLKAAEDRYQHFIHQSSEGIWRFELDEPVPVLLPLAEQIELCLQRAYLAECNDAMARMYGYERASDLVGMRISDFFPPTQDSMDYFTHFISSGYRVHDAESKELDRNGVLKHFSNNLVGIQQNGCLVRAWGTQRDITAQKMAEEQLRQSEEKYRTLFERMDQGFAILELLFDAGGKPVNYRFLETNPTFAHQTGLADAGGKLVTELVPGIEQHWFDIYGSVALTGEPLRFTEGSEVMGRWFDVHAFRLGDADSRRVAILFTDITDRKQAEQSIRESEARFQNLVRDASVGIVLLAGDNMKIEIVNKAYGALIDRTPEELLGQELFSFLPETEATYRPIIEQVLHSGQPYYMYDAFYEVYKDTRVVSGYLNLVFQPYHNQQGTVSGVLVLCQDVTASVMAKRSLEESENRFRSLANSMPQVVWIAEGDGRVLYYNNQIAHFSGALQQQDGTWMWQGVLHPEDVAPTEQAWKEAVASGNGYEKAHRIQMRDGSYRWHLSRAVPYSNEAGQVVKWYGTATDVHEQMLVQQELKLAKHQLELTFQNVPSPLYLMDASGKILYVNQQGALAMGFSTPEELMTANSLQQLHRQLNERFDMRKDDDQPLEQSDSASAQVLRTGKPARATLRFIDRRTGVSRWYISQSAPLFNEQGQVVMVLTADTDITTQRAFTQELEQQVADRTRELQRSNEDLQQFAHVASHDLKEPVRKVRTFASLLAMEFGNQLSDRARTYLAKIDASTDRIYNMIDGVLLYASLNARQELTAMVSLEELVHSIEADLEVVIGESGATITHQALPPLKGSPTLLYQLLYNLIGNALKFARIGVPPRIAIEASPAPATTIAEQGLDPSRPHLLLTISDNGIGFEPADSSRIFQTFSRLHSKDQYEGTGLGLSLCKKIVERHHGAIWAEGVPNEGSRFNILLPE